MIVICPEHDKQSLTDQQVDEQIDKCYSPIMEWKCPICDDLSRPIEDDSPSGLRSGFMFLEDYVTIQKRDDFKRVLLEHAESEPWIIQS